MKSGFGIRRPEKGRKKKIVKTLTNAGLFFGIGIVKELTIFSKAVKMKTGRPVGDGSPFIVPY